jgi:hypothetical protein
MSNLRNAVRAILAATALGAMLPSESARADGETITIANLPSSDFDLVIRLSGDGSTVVRTYATSVSSPTIVTRWRQDTGIAVVPPPAGASAWVAQSLDPSGNYIEGYTSADFTTKARIRDVAAGSYVAGFEAYKTATVAGGLGRAVTASDVPSASAYRYMPGSGFSLLGSIPLGSIARVHDATPSGTFKAVGHTSAVISGIVNQYGWVSDSSTVLQLLPIPSGESNSSAEDISDDGQTITGTFRRLLKGGIYAYKLARWTPSGTLAIEPAGGAQLINVLGASGDGGSVVVSMLDFAGNQRPESIWSAEHGFLTANQFMALRGYPAAPALDRIYDISADGGTVVAIRTNGDLVLIRGLVVGGCGEPGTESCFLDHDAPFCNDAECCSAVCTVDPFCCAVEWDAACVQGAQVRCAGCGDPKNAGCFVSHQSPGCSDLDCCTATCTVDPYCCDTAWDSLCADRALAECRSGDTCAEARLLSTFFPNSLTLDTNGVPADGVMTGCGTADTIGTWRLLRAACTGVTRLRICHPTGLATRGVITVYRTCGGAPIACSYSPGDCGFPNGARVDFLAIAGETYLIRFSAENGGLIGAGVTVDAPECQVVCGTGGPCSQPHGPGCNDAACCETVCTVDPFCCTNSWDSLCVSEAAELCFDPADIDRDGSVNAADLSALLANWGLAGATDINGDGITDAADLAILLANWG